jgi:hypothetical protein
MIRRNMVKSNASSVHPSHAATQASHCSLVGSFHHGTDDLEASAAADGLEASAAVVMAFPPRRLRVGNFGGSARRRHAGCAASREDFDKILLGSFAAKPTPQDCWLQRQSFTCGCGDCGGTMGISFQDPLLSPGIDGYDASTRA